MLSNVELDSGSRLSAMRDLLRSRKSQMPPADPEPLPEGDALLREFISQEDTRSAEILLARLLSEFAEPLIRRVIRAKLLGSEERQDADDVGSEVLLQLTYRLRNLRDAKDLSAIANFMAYVARSALYAYLWISPNETPNTVAFHEHA